MQWKHLGKISIDQFTLSPNFLIFCKNIFYKTGFNKGSTSHDK